MLNRQCASVPFHRNIRCVSARTIQSPSSRCRIQSRHFPPLKNSPLYRCFEEIVLPELPEVETVKRGLQPSVEGRRFTTVKTRRADLRIPFPDNFESRVTGRRVI